MVPLTQSLPSPHSAVRADLLEGVAAAGLEAGTDTPDVTMETPEQPDRPEQPGGSAGAGVNSNGNNSNSADDGEQYSFSVEDDTEDDEGDAAPVMLL